MYQRVVEVLQVIFGSSGPIEGISTGYGSHPRHWSRPWRFCFLPTMRSSPNNKVGNFDAHEGGPPSKY